MGVRRSQFNELILLFEVLSKETQHIRSVVNASKIETKAIFGTLTEHVHKLQRVLLSVLYWGRRFEDARLSSLPTLRPHFSDGELSRPKSCSFLQQSQQ